MSCGFSNVVALGPRRWTFTAYLGVEGVDQADRGGVLYLDSATKFAHITDGTSTTLMVGERPPSADGSLGWWYAGWGQSQDGSMEMVLSVRERNVHSKWVGFHYFCLPGPYHFVQDRVDNRCAAFHFWSLHPGGGHFLFADGSLRFLNYSVDPQLPALATRAGGDTTDPF